jgi:hypothetical protein
MDFDLTFEEGKYLVKLARKAIEVKLKTGGSFRPLDILEKMRESRGVFVTLNKVEGTGHRLRGCIGFPYPEKPLMEALIDAAISAAFRDPRFSPVSIDEMSSIVVEVSVLTLPELIQVEKPDMYLDYIEVGKTGLIVSRGHFRGLLLPQVPLEWGWDAEEFLTQCCLKARLPPDSWLTPDTQVFQFQAIIFSEESPNSSIRQVGLSI